MLTSNKQVFDNNWATVGFTDSPSPVVPFRPTTSYHYQYTIGDLQNPRSGLDIAVDQCQRLYDIYNKPLNVLLSGGVDSQAVAYAAYKSNVPYSITIIEFDKELNKHDVRFANELCKRYKIKPNVIQLPIIDFFTSGRYLNFTDKYLCDSPQIAMHLYAVSMVNMEQSDCVIFGGNPVVQYANKLAGVQQFTLMAWNRYSQMTGHTIIGNFHNWSQELFTKYYTHSDTTVWSHKEYQDKCDIYLKEGFDLVLPPSKFTGFEEIRKKFDVMYPNTIDAFNAMFRKPLQQKIHVSTTATILDSQGRPTLQG